MSDPPAISTKAIIVLYILLPQSKGIVRAMYNHSNPKVRNLCLIDCIILVSTDGAFAGMQCVVWAKQPNSPCEDSIGTFPCCKNQPEAYPGLYSSEINCRLYWRTMAGSLHIGSCEVSLELLDGL